MNIPPVVPSPARSEASSAEKRCYRSSHEAERTSVEEIEFSSRKVEPAGMTWWSPLLCRGENSAFSLVEITMALGIVAFGLISVVGLMPIGLTTLRQTVETSVSTQITQVVINEVQQADYKSLPATQLYYFDDQGNLLKSGSDPLKIYDVRLQITKGTTIPGSLGTSSENLATLSITISQAGTQAARKVSALVARSAN